MITKLKKYTLLCLLLFVVNSSFSQNYLDSLTVYISILSSDKKVEVINAIPFDVMNSNTSATIKMYRQALSIGSQNNNIEQLAVTNEKLALAHYYKGDYDLSVAASLEAIYFYEKSENTLKTGSIYASLGYQMKRRDLPKAFEYMRKGISLLERINDQLELSGAYNNFGVLHEMEEDIDSALFYYQKGLLIVEQISDSIGVPYSLNNIAGAYVIQGKYEEAMPYYNRAFRIRQQRNDMNGMAENYTYLGDFHFKQKLYKQAIPYYLKAENLCKQIDYIYLQKINSEQLAHCYTQLKHYEKALIYLKRTMNLKDSLLNESTNKAIAQFETQFETEKKEKEIAEQKGEIAEQELKVKKRNYSLIGFGGLIIFLIILGWNIYKQQRFKQNKLIEENHLKDKIAKVTVQNELHEERLRISRDLHDNIGSQLTFIISSVDNMKHLFKSVDEKLNEKLTDVSGFTRTTITQLRDTIWALNKDEISFEDLKARLYNYIENAQLAQDQTKFEFNSEVKINAHLNSIEGVNIYRIVQEAINNTMKYAAATNVILEILESDDKITLKIVDDGVGFNMPEIQLGNGLENMKSRAVAINAEFDITSQPQKGTEIKLTLNKNQLKIG